MTRTRPITFLAGAAVVPLIALVAAGCGGGGSDGAASATAPPTTATGQPATVGVADEDNLGSILVESRGRTLYLFQKDSGTRSACYGACAQDWPPLRATGQPTTGSEADASLIGTSARSDGKPQLTYNDHPLYLFSGTRRRATSTARARRHSGARGSRSPRPETPSPARPRPRATGRAQAAVMATSGTDPRRHSIVPAIAWPRR